MENLQRGGYCSVCNTIKPVAEFMRTLTHAQAKARGYSGMRRVEIESSQCKDCQRKPRPISALPNGEIRHRLSTGAIDPVTAKLILNRRHAKAVVSRKFAGARQAQRKWMQALKKLLAPMSAHIIGVDNWIRYQARKGVPSQAPSVVFMVAYLEQLRKERTRIKMEQVMHPEPVTHTAWQQYIPYDQRLELWKKWDALPPEERHRMVRTPPLLATYKE